LVAEGIEMMRRTPRSAPTISTATCCKVYLAYGNIGTGFEISVNLLDTRGKIKKDLFRLDRSDLAEEVPVSVFCMCCCWVRIDSALVK